jgi:hypothetical protein
MTVSVKLVVSEVNVWYGENWDEVYLERVVRKRCIRI